MFELYVTSLCILYVHSFRSSSQTKLPVIRVQGVAKIPSRCLFQEE